MLNPLLKIELLREGRGIRLSLLVIFYNAILALVTILIMLVNAQSFSEGYLYDPSASRFQFVIISTTQIVFAFLSATSLVWLLYGAESEKGANWQFSMIPGYCRQFVTARLSLVLLVEMFLFISSLPIILLSAIYSGVGWLQVVRLGAMILMLSFWSASLAIFCFSIGKKGVVRAFLNIMIQLLVFFGSYLAVAVINGRLRGFSIKRTAGQGSGILSLGKSLLSMFIMAFNPISSYMGYRINVTGDAGIFSSWCAGLGVDINSRLFSFVFYKLSAVILILSGFVLLNLSVRRLSAKKRWF